MTNELKPVRCGCGGKAAVLIGEDEFRRWKCVYKVKCWDCGMQTQQKRTRAVAIEVWNRAMGVAEKSSTVERTAKATRNPQAFFYHCECGYALCCEKNDMNYCPNCGARLEWE